MTFSSCEDHCASLGGTVACVTSDADETALDAHEGRAMCDRSSDSTTPTATGRVGLAGRLFVGARVRRVEGGPCALYCGVTLIRNVARLL